MLKSLIPVALKDQLKSFLRIGTHQYSYLMKVPRRKEVELSFLGNSFTLIDSWSFVFMYEEIFLREIYAFTTKSTHPIVIDFGGNIGLSALYFKSQFRLADVHVYEPDPFVFRVLKQNVERSNLNDGCLLYNEGVWSDEGVLHFEPDGSDGGRVSNKAIGNKTIEVKVVDAVQIVGRFKCVDFLKIDIEGAEVEVLKRLDGHLQNVDRLFLEYHSFNLGENLKTVLDIIENNGFQFYADSPGMKSKSPFKTLKIENEMDFQLNIYAFKAHAKPEIMK